MAWYDPFVGRAIGAIGDAIFGEPSSGGGGGGGGSAPPRPKQEKTSLLSSSIALRQRRGLDKASIARKQANIDKEKGKGLKSEKNAEAAIIAAFRRARAEAGKTNKSDFAGRTRV